MRLDDELRVLQALSVAYPVVLLSVAAFHGECGAGTARAAPAELNRPAQGAGLFLDAGGPSLHEVRARHRGAGHRSWRRTRPKQALCFGLGL